MNMALKVRTANNNRQAVGQHCTLTRIQNTTNSTFGFAVTDEGEEVYIPARVVKLYNMTEHDAIAGAGLTAPLRTNPRAQDEAGGTPWTMTPPIMWDGEAEEIETEVLEIPEDLSQEVEDLENDLIKLGGEMDDLLAVCTEGVQRVENDIRDLEPIKAIQLLNELRVRMENGRKFIADIVPEE